MLNFNQMPSIRNIVSLYFSCFCLIWPTYGWKYIGQQANKRLTNSTDFDVFVFTQHWPPTVCYLWREKVSNHSCSLSTSEEWTIHGLWPTQNHKVGPQFCDKSLPFDVNALNEIRSELELKWTDVENRKPRSSFWRHEWEKHGTCAAALESLNTELKYFKKGLELLDTYDMKHVLAKASIVPGQNYTIQSLLEGVQKILGKKPEILCVVSKDKKISYIFEIRICLDKKFQLVDCDNITQFPTNCKLSTSLLYPTNTPEDYQVIQIL
ncbi:ribonuclease Oy [Prorops nasuta]|uniref:ribonuclease Oy n=1 Tax=Prorops nasuta TaxID=863751 RepID=UPI0034CEF9CE